MAERVPKAFGRNVTLTEQLAPPGTEVPQVFVWAKSSGFVPATAMELMESGVPARLVNVTSLARLLVPTVCVPKLRLEGESATLVTTCVIELPTFGLKFASPE